MRKNAVLNYPFDFWFLSERGRTLANDRLSDSHSDHSFQRPGRKSRRWKEQSRTALALFQDVKVVCRIARRQSRAMWKIERASLGRITWACQPRNPSRRTAARRSPKPSLVTMSIAPSANPAVAGVGIPVREQARRERPRRRRSPSDGSDRRVRESIRGRNPTRPA